MALLANISLPLSVTILLRDDRALSSLCQPFFLEGINHFPAGTLNSLSIVGFNPVPDPIFDGPKFRRALSSLEFLHPATPHKVKYDIEDLFYNLDLRNDDFWARHAIGDFFSSLQALKSLSICTKWFLRPIMSGPPFGVVLPCLESLTLKGCLFGRNPEGGPTPQSFVIAYKHSLKSLKLKNCPVSVRDPKVGFPTAIQSAAEV